MDISRLAELMARAAPGNWRFLALCLYCHVYDTHELILQMHNIKMVTKPE